MKIGREINKISFWHQTFSVIGLGAIIFSAQFSSTATPPIILPGEIAFGPEIFVRSMI